MEIKEQLNLPERQTSPDKQSPVSPHTKTKASEDRRPEQLIYNIFIPLILHLQLIITEHLRERKMETQCFRQTAQTFTDLTDFCELCVSFNLLGIFRASTTGIWHQVKMKVTETSFKVHPCISLNSTTVKGEDFVVDEFLYLLQYIYFFFSLRRYNLFIMEEFGIHSWMNQGLRACLHLNSWNSINL